MANVYRLDPHDDKLGLLTPFLAKRIERYAEDYQPEVIAADYASGVMAELWRGNPSVLALGIVDPDSAKLLGHCLAVAAQHGKRTRIEIVQLQADQNVGNARFEALEHVLGWAKENGVEQVLLMTHRDGKDFEAKLGFKRMRTVMQHVAAPPIPAAEG